jgi:uncharacterized cysteine cluster protein YcgN (CxxCxxCC family)
MSGDDAELAHYVSQTKGIDVLARNAVSAVCDGCGASPQP